MAARTCAGMARFIGIRALPGHSIADEIHKVAEDSYCAEQQEPRRGLLVHALNEFHLSAFCAYSASRRITHGKGGDISPTRVAAKGSADESKAWRRRRGSATRRLLTLVDVGTDRHRCFATGAAVLLSAQSVAVPHPRAGTSCAPGSLQTSAVARGLFRHRSARAGFSMVLVCAGRDRVYSSNSSFRLGGVPAE